MNIRFSWLMLVGMALAGSAAPGLLAQTRPDLSGLWAREGRTAQVNFSEEVPPMQAWARAVYDENQGGAAVRGQGLDELDPTTYCLPVGMPRAMAYNYPFEIVQTPQVVYVLFESWRCSGASTWTGASSGRELH
jgi:hypothetical protein